MMPASLAPIAIIVAGSNTPQGAAMLRIAEKHPDRYHMIDVRQWLFRDPGEGKAFKIPHDMNSDFLPCQLSLLKSKEAIVECVKVVA